MEECKHNAIYQDEEKIEKINMLFKLREGNKKEIRICKEKIKRFNKQIEENKFRHDEAYVKTRLKSERLEIERLENRTLIIENWIREVKNS